MKIIKPKMYDFHLKANQIIGNRFSLYFLGEVNFEFVKKVTELTKKYQPKKKTYVKNKKNNNRSKI